MNHTQTLILASCLFLLTGIPAHAQHKEDATYTTSPEDIYKHYTGTLGNRHIALDLRFGYQGGSNYGGSTWYFIDSPGQTLFFITQPDSDSHNVTLKAWEESTADNKQDTARAWTDLRDRNPTQGNSAEWELIIAGKNITGMRHSADGVTNERVLLAEDYSNAVPMDMMIYTDSSHPPAAFYGVGPAASVSRKDAGFINEATIAFLGDDKSSAWPGYFKYYSESYEAALPARQPLITKQDSMLDAIHAVTDTRKRITCLMPAYNDDGFLVLERLYYPGIKKGDNASGTSWLCLDVRSHRQLTMDYMLDADSATLCPLLTAEAARKYNIPPGKKLSSLFTTDTLPFPTCVRPAHKGLIFSYKPGEVTSLIDDPFITNNPIEIFLSYDQLAPMLTKKFKKRLGIAN